LHDPADVEIVGSGERKHDGKTYRVIFGKPKNGDGSVEQAYRYPREAWSLAEAKAHCEAHHGMMFEPASENQIWHENSAYFCPKNNMIEQDGVLKIPTVFTMEGVQNGGFKSREELRKAARWLQNRPVVINHPSRWPGVVREDTPIYGYTSDVRFQEDVMGVYGFTNLELDKTPGEIIERIRERKLKAGSVGYWSKDVPAPLGSEWNGTPFKFLETNILFDHYAILPNQDGACSVHEGCGLQVDMQNSRVQPKGSTNLNQAQMGEKGEKTMDEKPKDTPKTPEELESELNALKAEQDKIVDERVRQFKMDFEAKKNELAAKDQDLLKVKGERDALLAKMNAMVQAEKQRLEAAKNHLIAEIVAQTGESPDTYNGWDVAQLQKLNEVLKSNQVDRFAKTPRSPSADFEAPQPTLGSPLDPRTAKNWKEP
jgi:hypothetical protein